jgi:hypothetical protein
LSDDFKHLNRLAQLGFFTGGQCASHDNFFYSNLFAAPGYRPQNTTVGLPQLA